eukprot:TRINITY_DN2321_c0_g1_i7.p1 TRINITY_DN2321_c0_g1~~TRINITY_DN2321_c0_g1_i7.p1  ORF type:complete len:196 (-),score=36.63 TRINITY_DN2321_c0_g1_i7:116-703(-)
MKRTSVHEERHIESLAAGHFFVITEAAGEGNADKVCDQLSEAIVDAYLRVDSQAKINCEVALSNSKFYVFGEMELRGSIDLLNVVKETIKRIGYDDEEKGMNYKGLEVDFEVKIAYIDSKKNKYKESDYTNWQGVITGYATAEWDDTVLCPLGNYIANRICQELSLARKQKMKYLRPDCKVQVTIEYEQNHQLMN